MIAVFKPKPESFGPDAIRLLFRVESSMLKAGREYRPHITVNTDAGILRPQLGIQETVAMDNDRDSSDYRINCVFVNDAVRGLVLRENTRLSEEST